MDDTPPVLSRDNAETPPCLATVDDIVTRLRTMDVDEYSDVLGVLDEAADEIERLRAAGDVLAVHLLSRYKPGQPLPVDIEKAIEIWSPSWMTS